MMDSEIELESELGKGSTFGFHVTLEIAKEQYNTKNAKQESLNTEGKRILVVEDNDLNMEIITTLLEDYKIIVEPVYNGKEAVDKVKASPPGYYDAGYGWKGSSKGDSKTASQRLSGTADHCNECECI